MSKELDEPELMNLKDCKSAADFSFDKCEIFSGDTPHNINQICLKFCQDYLAGIWLQQTVDTITVKRLSGGLTNQMYYCSLSDQLKDKSCDGVPQEVAIRLYGPKHIIEDRDGSNERLKDLIISLMVSENNLGPKIYGFFEEGQIQHYHKHRHFRYEEQNHPHLPEQLFRKIAKLHSMDVPIKKTKNFLFDFFDDFYEKAYKKFPINEMIDDWNLVTLKKYEVKSEIAWLKEAITKMNSPQVFIHVDLTGANTMVTEPNDEIILCDFEYSTYGYRGFDLGTVLGEWGLKVDELFKVENHLEKYPDDAKIRSLLRPYIEESVKIFGKKYSENKNNSLNQLIRETKLFSMVYDFFVLLFFLKNDENDGGIDKKILMEMGEMMYKGYWQLKEKFIQDKVFD